MIRNFQTVEIVKVVKENPFIKTFFFDEKIEAEPGQFVMLWIPGVDEKPFGFSYLGRQCAISVLRRGEFTKKMHKLKKGAKIGVRGPYGNGFNVAGIKKAVIVGGGCGIVILKPLAEELKKQKVKLDILIAARNKKHLVFGKELRKVGRLTVYTDDGSVGRKGFVTQGLKEVLEKGKVDCVFSCGPELMMLNVFKLCEKYRVKSQLALERMFKCAIGICGQCAINDKLVCRDGPVFNEKQLRKLKEFGTFTRKKSWGKTKLQEC